MILRGLNPTPREKQKYSFGAIFGYVPPEQLPEEWDSGLLPIEIKNQNIPEPSFVCVAESGVSVSEYQEGVALEPAYRIKNISKILGGTEWVNQGTDLSTGMKAALLGDLERGESPFSVEKDGVEKVADPANWPATYDEIAKKHAKKAGFWIGTSGKLSMFDAIRGAIYRFKDEKRAVQTGLLWQDTFLTTYITIEGNPTGGHAVTIMPKWKKDYLVIQNSVGKGIGENGIQYIHKNLVNKLFKFGALMFLDMPEYQSHESIILKSEIYRAPSWKMLWILLKNFKFPKW